MVDQVENNIPINPLDLSDEEFLKIDSPEAMENYHTDQSVVDQESEIVSEDGVNGNEPTPEDEPEGEKVDTEIQEEKQKDAVEAAPQSAIPEDDSIQTKKEELEKTTEGDKPESEISATGSTEEQKPVDHKAFFEQVMAPFKANGKTIKLNSPEEVIQLMQMGANYARKMNAIQPHRKVLTMLENNGLLDENRLSYLIDLDKKNPEAIKKLIKDSGIDPLGIDTETETNYLEGNHKVTDAEVHFRANLDELSSTPTGKETLQAINTTWDETSKEVLWEEPSLMPIIHSQRETGIYDRIVNEMDRQKMLGKITPDTPFLKAYKDIGDSLAAVGGFDDLLKLQEKQSDATPITPVNQTDKTVLTPEIEPVATRVVKPKPAVTNGDKVDAASTTRSVNKPAKPIINPLAMSDAEFMANFQGRV